MRSLLLLASLLMAVSIAPAAAPTTKPVTITKPITVTVVDAETGKPLEGATVALRDRRYPAGASVDADGRYIVQYDPTHGYQSILCRKSGYVPTTVYWQEKTGTAVELPDEVTVPLPRGKKVSSKVVNEAGEPVAGVKVILEHWPQPEEKTSPVIIARIADEIMETNAAGRWTYDGYPSGNPKISIRLDHPDYVRDHVGRYPEPAGLLDESAILKLDAGVEIVGQVLSTRDKPIKGATVTTIRHRHISNDYGVTTTSGADGKFRLAHMRAEETAITVTAAGFAPEMQRAQVAIGMPELKFVLPDAQRLNARVVDGDGNPLAGASVSISEWRGLRSLAWSAQTDADGRFTWLDAPADTVALSISKRGYRYIIRHPLTAAADEAVVTMLPETKVRGAVTDARTGMAIDNFRAIEGAALWDGRPPSFSFDEARTFTGGAYELTIDAHDEVVASYVRIEADGYRPAISPPIRSAAATFDAALEAGDDITGTLIAPDGTPVANAIVHLALPCTQIDIWSNQVQRSATVTSTTDSAGRFRFSPQAGEFHLIVLSDSGYAWMTVDASAKHVDLTLTSWSGIEGFYRPGDKVESNHPFYLSIDPVRDPRDTSPNFIWRLDVSIDDAGRYRAERVPGFGGQGCTLMIGRMGESIDERRWLPVRLEAGKTLQLNVEGGRTLRGRAIPASHNDALPSPRGMVLLKPTRELAAMLWPADIAKAAAMAEPAYRCDVQTDGSFVVPSLPPGSYEYSLSMYSGRDFATASGALTVNAGDGDADAGTIHYVRAGAVTAGQPAPATLGRRFDEKPIRTDDYAGKFIVLAVWDSCTGRSDAHIPHLNKLAETLGSDARVALISVNMDAISCGMTGIPRRPSTLSTAAWLSGYLPLADQQLLTRFGDRKWPAILIIGTDGKVLARDLDASDVSEKLAAAMRQ